MPDSAKPQEHLVALDVLRPLAGHRLLRVEYKTVGDPIEDVERAYPGAVHDVGHAVLLSTEASTVALEWCICGYAEFLNIADPPSEGAAAAVLDIVDVTGLPQWNPLIGQVMVDFGMATQQSEEGQELPWAVRVSTASGAAFVVGLGAVRDGAPYCQPDNLVVIFNPVTARSYEVQGASDSAWGRDVHW